MPPFYCCRTVFPLVSPPFIASYLGSSCSLRQCCLSSTLPDRGSCSISSAGCSAGRQLSGCRAPSGWTRAGSHWTTSWETEIDAPLEQRGDPLVPSCSFIMMSKSRWIMKLTFWTYTVYCWEHQYVKQILEMETEQRLTCSSLTTALRLWYEIIFTALMAQISSYYLVW